MTQLTMLDEQKTKDKFIAVYKAVHKCNDEDAKNLFEVEAHSFQRAIAETPALQECTDLSKIGAFIEVISNGLSFDKSNKHVYLMPRNVNVAPRGQQQQWQKRLTYQYAADGLIYLCTAAKSIESCTSPILVYRGETIEMEMTDGHLKIHHKISIPRTSNDILGGYCYVVTKNGKEPFWMGIEEVERLKTYSAKSNKSQSNPDGKVNELYFSNGGQIDEGFFKTKIIKAALKNYRKKVTLNDNLFEEEIESFDDDLTAPVQSITAPVQDDSAPVQNDSDLIF